MRQAWPDTVVAKDAKEFLLPILGHWALLSKGGLLPPEDNGPFEQPVETVP